MLLALHVGNRRMADADILITKLQYRLENIPLFVSDGLYFYKKALLNAYGTPGKKNHSDKRFTRPPKLVPPKELRYGQFVKTVREGKLTRSERRSVFGTVDEKDITTSAVERLNLTLRQENNRISRKTIGPSRSIKHLTTHMSFYMRYYNMCRPHLSHKIRGIEYGTPAMAAGVTDEVWSIRKLLFFPYRNYVN